MDFKNGHRVCIPFLFNKLIGVFCKGKSREPGGSITNNQGKFDVNLGNTRVKGCVIAKTVVQGKVRFFTQKGKNFTTSNYATRN